jgi:hypothetical protein
MTRERVSESRIYLTQHHQVFGFCKSAVELSFTELLRLRIHMQGRRQVLRTGGSEIFPSFPFLP